MIRGPGLAATFFSFPGASDLLASFSSPAVTGLITTCRSFLGLNKLRPKLFDRCLVAGVVGLADWWSGRTNSGLAGSYGSSVWFGKMWIRGSILRTSTI